MRIREEPQGYLGKWVSDRVVQELIPGWLAVFRLLPSVVGTFQPLLHMLSHGPKAPLACTLNYKCCSLTPLLWGADTNIRIRHLKNGTAIET